MNGSHARVLHFVRHCRWRLQRWRSKRSGNMRNKGFGSLRASCPFAFEVWCFKGSVPALARQDIRNVPRNHPSSSLGWWPPYWRAIEVIIARTRVIPVASHLAKVVRVTFLVRGYSSARSKLGSQLAKGEKKLGGGEACICSNFSIFTPCKF